MKKLSKNKKYPQGKPTLDQSVNWLEFQIEDLELKYDKYSRDYAHMISQGVGLTSIHVLDTLRTLTWLYTDIAAHKSALRSLKTELH